MGKKKRKGGDAPASKPKGLRKQLRRAEADLAKAVAKRDKAQARVEAMSIIADEIRAQLAERDKAAKAAKAAKAEAASKDTAEAKTTGATSKASSARAKPPATAAAPKRKTTARKAATPKKAPSTKAAQPRSRSRKSPPAS